MARVLCPILVGRDEEVAVLDGALERLERGLGGCVLLVGEAGIGKSRLLRELAVRAEASGFGVVTGRATPTAANAAYRPLTEALQQLLRDREVPADAGMSRWLSPLAPLLPNIGRLGEQTVPLAVRAEAVLQLVRRLAGRGVVMLLEDLHWADPDTIGMVEYLADNVEREPLLLGVSARPDPVSPTRDLVVRRRSGPGVVQLPLGRLDDRSCAAMAAACGVDAPDEHVAWVIRTAEGIPLLIEDLLASPGLPTSVAASVRERLEALPPGARTVMAAAAVLGRHFDWQLLPDASGAPEDVVADALAAGVECLLLVSDGKGFRFRHALTREAVLSATLPPAQRDLAARALAAVQAAHPQLEAGWREVAVDLAARAGEPSRAGALLVESGRDSLRMGALATASETLRRAVDLLDDDAAAGAGLLLIEALSLAGEVDEGAAVANAILRRIADRPNAPLLRTQVHLAVAESAVGAARWTMARHELGLAERLAVDPPPELRARIGLVAAELALADDDPDRARRTAEDALAAEAVGAPVRCHAYEIVGRTRRLRDLAAAEAAFEAALAAADDAVLPVWRLRALHELGTIDMFDHAGVDRLVQARQQAETMGALVTVATLDLQLSACYTSRWNLDRCDAHADSALELAERLGLEQVRAKALAMRAGSASMRADPDATDGYCRLAVDAAPGDQMLRGFCLTCRGVAWLMAAQPELGSDAYREGMAVLSRLPNAEPAANRALWPLVLASLGDTRAADAIGEARRLGVSAFTMNRGLLDWAEAVLAGRAGDRRRADALAARAAATFVNSGTWAVLARYLAAAAARSDGWGEPQAWLAEAVDVFSVHGLERLAARAGELQRAGEPNPWAAEGITNREADVLRLIGQGLANKEIAILLRVSPRTVEKHVESLLRKTGRRNRVDLALRAGAT